jgi:hypothetical protein
MRRRVAQAVKAAKRCKPRWYGISMPFTITMALLKTGDDVADAFL